MASPETIHTVQLISIQYTYLSYEKKSRIKEQELYRNVRLYSR